MVNTAFALKFTTPCKQVSKCGIYHLCFRFTPSLHFFASYLHLKNKKFSFQELKIYYNKYFAPCLVGLSLNPTNTS